MLRMEKLFVFLPHLRISSLLHFCSWDYHEVTHRGGGNIGKPVAVPIYLLAS